MKAKRAVGVLRRLLEEIQKKRLHEPDPDGYERCADCGNYYLNQHKPGCLVPRIRLVLEQTKRLED